MAHTQPVSRFVAALLLIACGSQEQEPPGVGSTSVAPGPTSSDASATQTDGSPSGTSAPDSSTGATTPATSGSGSSTKPGGASTTSSASTGDECSCNFICAPGDGSACESDGTGVDVACDLWTQDCPDGQKCVAWAGDGGTGWNEAKCVDVTGSGLPGEPCTVVGSAFSGEDSCVEGAMCWEVDTNGDGTCVGLCQGTPDFPSCAAYPGTNVTGGNFLCLCLPGCDPLLQNCQSGDLCISSNGDGFSCILDASGDIGAVGDPCEYANACDPGNACIDAAAFPGCSGSSGCCANFCNLQDGDAGCTWPGTVCVPWYEPGTAPPADVDVGVCKLPP